MFQMSSIRRDFDQTSVVITDGYIVFLDFSKSHLVHVPYFIILVSDIGAILSFAAVDSISMFSHIPLA